MMLRHAFLMTAMLGLALPATDAVGGVPGNVPAGTTTPFTDGIFSFSSPSDPGAYYVGPTNGLFATLTGDALLASSATPTPLDIGFATPVDEVTLDFALTDFYATGGNDVLDWSTNDGAGASGSTSAVVPSGFFYPEGAFFYSGTPITELTLSSAYTISVDSVGIPEPSTIALLSVGWLGVSLLRRRRVAGKRAADPLAR